MIYERSPIWVNVNGFLHLHPFLINSHNLEKTHFLTQIAYHDS